MFTPKHFLLRMIRNITYLTALCMLSTTAMASDAEMIACNDGSLNQDSAPQASITRAGNLAVDDCIEVDDADTPWRYVGISPMGECPVNLENWSSSHLFALPQAELPTSLSKFCLFTANILTMPVVGELQNQLCSPSNQNDDCLSQINADSAAMAMMGSDMANVLWQPLHQQFLEQVDPVTQIPPVASPRTRLTFIDTEPTGLDQDSVTSGVSQHGFTLINLARDMLCPASVSPTSDSCGVEINSELGLPLRRCASNIGYCLNPAIGGHAGTISQLALAIRTAVHDAASTGRNQHVINLSVAWDPALSGGTIPSNSRTAVQAAYRALQYASCQGVLVIAAAGNRVSGPTVSTKPLLPAGWEVEAAPSQAQCDSLGFNYPTNAFDGQYRPLLHAISAVRMDNSPAETRVDGEPRLTAFGDHAVASITDATTDEPTQILTGSSVAAAVASSAAAAAWFYIPTASAHEIMDAMYNSGAGTNRIADFCIGGQFCSPLDVRRLTICETVNKACSDLGGSDCTIFVCEAPSSVLPAVSEEDIVALFDTTPNVRVESLAQLTTQTLLDECRTGYTLHTVDSSPTDNPCPQLQFFGAQATPWTDGQPEDQFCPTCTETYHSPGKLYVDIDSTLVGTLDDITLTCGENAFRIPGQLNANSKLVITDIPEGCEFENVSLAYSLDNGSGSLASLGSPALLLPDRDDDDIQDGADNCVDYPNPQQLDTDGDGFGNQCDADFDNDCSTNFLDYFLLTEEFPGFDPNLDITGDGIVNFFDIARFPELNGQPPGPSGFSDSCDNSP